MELFGDEAEATFNNDPAYLFLYALVALHPVSRPFVEAKMADVKRRLRPHLDPSTWVFHTLHLRNPRWRQKHGLGLSTPEIDGALQELAGMLGEVDGSRIISITVFLPFNLQGFGTGENTKRMIQDRVLAAAIIGLTEAYAKQGWGLRFTFEARTELHKAGWIDGAIERVGRGLRFDLGFVYSCKGMPVGLPVTAPKSAHLEMELADLVAFMVRRYFVKLLEGRETELPLETLQTVLWGAFTETHFGTHHATGFPWSHFYPSLT